MTSQYDGPQLVRHRATDSGVLTDESLASSRGDGMTSSTTSLDQDDTSETKTTGGSCIKGWLEGRLDEQKKLLLLDVCILLWSIAVGVVIYNEINAESYGQCMLGMPLYSGGLDPKNVQQFWCRCPLYTVILSSCVPWISVMVNWVSDLHSKKAAFYKWLKWQASITAVGGITVLGSTVLTVVGFSTWCEHIYESLVPDDSGAREHEYPSRLCYKTATEFDTKHQDEFVKLTHIFIYTVIITAMLLIHVVFWASANFYTLKLLYREPKDNFSLAAYEETLRNAQEALMKRSASQRGARMSQMGAGEGTAEAVNQIVVEHNDDQSSTMESSVLGENLNAAFTAETIVPHTEEEAKLG